MTLASVDRYDSDAVSSVGDHAVVGGGGSIAGLCAARVLADAFEEVVDTVWQMAAGTDFAFPQTNGDEPFGVSGFDRCVARLLRRAHSDPASSEAFLRVLRLERPPKTLLRPRVAWQTLGPTSRSQPLRSLTPLPNR